MEAGSNLLKNMNQFPKSAGRKAPGSMSSERTFSTSPFRFVRIMSISGPQSSAMTCRQAPHGEHGLSVSATTAMAVNSFTPSETALKMAVRSAQFVIGYAAFSILQPWKTRPSFERRAAPTANFEYGTYAASHALIASLIRSLTSTLFHAHKLVLRGIA